MSKTARTPYRRKKKTKTKSLKVGPLNPARGLGSAVGSPSGVWGSGQILDFGAF